MIYITGDTHGDFWKFTKYQRKLLPFRMGEGDYVIVCGDFGLLWAEGRKFHSNLHTLSSLPFTVLWVQGNHENYDMIAGYAAEEWHGGKVRHIIRDKVILMERGQLFDIEGRRFFAFGGAASHDISGGVLDPLDPHYAEKYKAARRSGLPYRIKGVSWWEEELPTQAELDEGLWNLERVNYNVDYVISHCASTRVQKQLEGPYAAFGGGLYKPDLLTDHFDELEEKLKFRHWYFGHYHLDREVDEAHTAVYQRIVPVGSGNDGAL